MMKAKCSLPFPKGIRQTEELDPRRVFFRETSLLLDERYRVSESPSSIQRGNRHCGITVVHNQIADLEKGSGPARQVQHSLYHVGSIAHVYSIDLRQTLNIAESNLNSIPDIIAADNQGRYPNGQVVNIANLQFHSEKTKHDVWGHVGILNLVTSGFWIFSATSGTLSFVLISGSKAGISLLPDRREICSTHSALTSTSRTGAQLRDWIADSVSHLENLAKQAFHGLGVFQQEFFLIIRHV